MSASSQRSADGYCPKPSPAQETSLTAETPFLPAASGKEKLSLRESKLLGLPVGFPEDTRQSCRFLRSLQREPEQKTNPQLPAAAALPEELPAPQQSLTWAVFLAPVFQPGCEVLQQTVPAAATHITGTRLLCPWSRRLLLLLGGSG